MAEVHQPNGVLHTRKLVLRLDDGSLIGSADTLLGSGSNGGPGAMLLDFEAACRTGRAGKNELQRLDRLINDFQGRVSGFHSIPRNEIKQRNPYTQDVQRAIKRQRSLAAGELPPFLPDPQQQQLQHQQQQQPLSADFYMKCMEVLKRVYAACNTIQPIFHLSAKDVFYRPVRETFPSIADHYYSVIHNPMTFGTIEQRILQRQYVNAQQFADDMRLVFDNCKKYNPMSTDPVRLASLKLSEVFEGSWISLGLCAEAQRAKRATAGIAAPKFEPEEYDAAAQQPRRTNSHAGGEQPLQRRPQQDGMGRQPSHEVSSYREEEVEQHSIPEDVLQEVAAALQELGPDNLQVALDKFNEGVVSFDAEGEVELDLEKVDYASLMEVDAYIREVNNLPPRVMPQAQPVSGPPSQGVVDDAGAGQSKGAVRAEQDDDDDYYEEEESDDDD